jgi:hypothetical protein
VPLNFQFPPFASSTVPTIKLSSRSASKLPHFPPFTSSTVPTIKLSSRSASKLIQFRPSVSSMISAGERLQAAHLLRSWVRIPRGAWIFACCECRVLSGRGLCDELITRPEESYLLCCVVVCDLETSRIGAPYIFDISSLRVNDLTLILLTWRKW